MARRYEIGRNFYAISGTAANAPTVSAWSAKPHLVMQAHGMGSTRWFDLSLGTQVRFYVYEGETLSVASNRGPNFNYYDTIRDVFHGDAVALDVHDGPGRCPNYYLSKFQVSQRGPNTPTGKTKVSYDDLEAYVDRWSNLPYDIATVRDRTFGATPDLESLIEGCRKSAHAYATYHVLICRSANDGATKVRVVTQADMQAGKRRFA